MKQSDRYSEQFLRRRKMMLVVPVVFVPMLYLAFYGLGGGKGDAGGPAAGEMKGLNMTLPLARIDTRSQPQDKLGFYEKAKQDSMRLQERKKQDPYAAGVLSAVRADSVSRRQQADEALARLERLKQVLGKRVEDTMEMNRSSQAVGNSAVRMNALLDPFKGASASRGDPQMEQLDGMLDKLIRIQHPDLMNTDTARSSGVAVALVSPSRLETSMGRLASDTDEGESGVRFMEIAESDAGDTVRDAAIEAVINGDQTLTSGSTVALRIVHGVWVNGREIPANQLVYGEASLSGERLMIGIRSLRVGESIVPVSMQVYDLDGLAGIRVPGAITRDVSKESADQALSGLEMASVDPSLSAQAASAGLAFAKSLASRKIRLVRVALPAGYRVLLKNSKSFTH